MSYLHTRLHETFAFFHSDVRMRMQDAERAFEASIQGLPVDSVLNNINSVVSATGQAAGAVAPVAFKVRGVHG
jgi:hypothetical protein